MSHDLFPELIETDRLHIRRVAHDTLDLWEAYELTTTDRWQEQVTEHMPWYGFDRLDQLKEFVDGAERQWKEAEKAAYAIRLGDAERPGTEPGAGDLVGFTALGPEWEKRRAGSGIVLDPDVWGEGYATERAKEMVRLTFERLHLDAYYATCAAGNDRSRQMIERYVSHFGGRHEGLLRQHSPRPDGSITDQHRFTITREEYESAGSND